MRIKNIARDVNYNVLFGFWWCQETRKMHVTGSKKYSAIMLEWICSFYQGEYDCLNEAWRVQFELENISLDTFMVAIKNAEETFVLEPVKSFRRLMR